MDKEFEIKLLDAIAFERSINSMLEREHKKQIEKVSDLIASLDEQKTDHPIFGKMDEDTKQKFSKYANDLLEWEERKFDFYLQGIFRLVYNINSDIDMRSLDAIRVIKFLQKFEVEGYIQKKEAFGFEFCYVITSEGYKYIESIKQIVASSKKENYINKTERIKFILTLLIPNIITLTIAILALIK